MGLDDKVYADVNPEEPRNENLEGGKSTQCHVDEAQEEKKVAQHQKSDAPTHPHKDPDEIKAETDLLPEDATRKADLSSGDSEM